jgi:hypothetical protein
VFVLGNGNVQRWLGGSTSLHCAGDSSTRHTQASDSQASYTKTNQACIESNSYTNRVTNSNAPNNFNSSIHTKSVVITRYCFKTCLTRILGMVDEFTKLKLF